ncbi:haloacid dehalogenase-like hydrolase [Bifidobacterium pullorum]|uniref:haloacid dehalogenase-like hydrolase n=1 Tax=Bifidobacterium pullorum TaxID=78448 RepID=UPI000529705F|nr:haloacid dehalogenase-like hydrolase [Bifidobacterium pullorum]
MRVFDFDGTIYKGESLFDLYLFSVRYEPRVLKYVAPVAQCGIRYKTGHAELAPMERKLGRIIRRYLQDIDSSKRVARLCGSGSAPTVPGKREGVPDAAAHAGLNALSEAFWNRKFRKIKSWYTPQPDDVIVTASFDLTVGEACRRLGITNLIASTIDPETLEISHLNFRTNKAKRFREVYGPDAVIDEFYTDSYHDQSMIDMARTAYLVKGNKLIRIK